MPNFDIHLRRRYVALAQARRPRLSGNLRQLGAVGAVVPPIAPQSRVVIVKTTVTGSATTGHHVAYLQRAKGVNGQAADLFGPHAHASRSFIQAAQQDPHQFRLIVSVPAHRQLDRTQYITLFMAQAERDLGGHPLQWLAAHHYDTDHPHTHIVLRAEPRAGKDLYMAKHYLTYGLRARASALLTWILGPVRQQDLAPQQQQFQILYRQSDRLIRDGVPRDAEDPDLRQTRVPTTGERPTGETAAGLAAHAAALQQRLAAQAAQRQQGQGWGPGRR